MISKRWFHGFGDPGRDGFEMKSISTHSKRLYLWYTLKYKGFQFWLKHLVTAETSLAAPRHSCTAALKPPNAYSPSASQRQTISPHLHHQSAMKISTSLLALFLSSLVAAEGLSFNPFSGQKPLAGERATVPGDSPLTYCNGEHDDDLLVIEYINLDPNPPEK